MNRIPFVAAVVGALLVGGATTGTTHARWTDQAKLSASSITAGKMGFGTTQDKESVTLDKLSTSSADVILTVDEDSAGKNLTQRVTASVTGVPTDVTATVATTCGGSIYHHDLAPGASNQTFCVRILSSDTATTGNVTVQLLGAQVRDEIPNGWTTLPQSRSVEVKLNESAAPAAPTNFRCGTPAFQNNNVVNLAWNGSSTTGYKIYRRAGTSPSFSYTLVKTVAGSATSTSVNRNSDFSPAVSSATLVVRAVNGAVESGDSNAVTVNYTGQACS